MLDIGWTELLVIAIVLIVVVGPKDLPPMLRAFGKMTANLRKMAGEFRTQFDEALRESELDDVRKTISDAQRLNPSNALRDAINPLRQMGQEIRSDLQKATQVPTAKTDAVTDQSAEGSSSQPEPEASFPAPAMTLPPTPPVVAAPAEPLAASPVAPTAEARKAPRRAAKPKAEAQQAGAEKVASSEKPKRSRVAAKPAPVTKSVEEAAVKAKARKSSTTKTAKPKDDA